jgi:hypothetical protein
VNVMLGDGGNVDLKSGAVEVAVSGGQAYGGQGGTIVTFTPTAAAAEPARRRSPCRRHEALVRELRQL